LTFPANESLTNTLFFWQEKWFLSEMMKYLNVALFRRFSLGCLAMRPWLPVKAALVAS
jgi:hypothetical protein